MTTPAQIELLARALAEQYFEGRSSDPWDSAVKYDWDNRDDLHKAGWKLSATVILTQLGPLDPLGAVAMRKCAAEGGVAVSSFERRMLAVSAADCGATMIGAYVYVSQASILAIPLPTHADRLAAALALPEIARLVEALLWCSGSADFGEGGIARDGWLKLAAPALAALTTAAAVETKGDA